MNLMQRLKCFSTPLPRSYSCRYWSNFAGKGNCLISSERTVAHITFLQRLSKLTAENKIPKYIKYNKKARKIAIEIAVAKSTC